MLALALQHCAIMKTHLNAQSEPKQPGTEPRTPEIEPAKSPHIDIPQPNAPQGPVITPPEPTVPVRG